MDSFSLVGVVNTEFFPSFIKLEFYKKVNSKNLTFRFIRAFFWEPIPVNRYENHSGYGPDSALIMPHYWYFSETCSQFCKKSGVPTMLRVFSLSYTNHSIPFITAFLFKMCHSPRKVATVNRLIKIDNSSINYSGENKLVLILGYNF